MKHLFYTLFLLAFGPLLLAQELTPESDTLNMMVEEKPTIELNPNAVDKKDAKKKAKKKKAPKRKKNDFWGVFAKKVFLKKQRGRTIITEKFYILPAYEAPTKYVYDKYYFDPKNTKRREVVKTHNIGEKYGIPLHGSYEKRINGEIVEQGYYYKGVKHGRWMKYGRDRDGDKWVLLSKENWDKGYPKGSYIDYYDKKRRYVEQVIPMTYGKREGLFISFYKNGRIREMGYYQNGHKVGRWKQFYDKGRANWKSIIDYPKNYWEEGEPVVVDEW